jgi:hypothetical protein
MEGTAMSKCRQIRGDLATYRELATDDRARVDAHLAACGDCAATWSRYQRQDQILAALPRLRPATRPAELLAKARPQPAPRRWAYAVALAGVLLLAGLGTTARASADALPGDPLYAVKRAMETMRQTVTLREQARAELTQELAERRRAEAREVQQTRRTAELSFEGRVQAAEAGMWTVEGFALGVAPVVWPGEPPLGQVVRVRAQAVDGQFTALELWLHAPGAAGYPGPGDPPPSWAPGGAYPGPYPGPQAAPDSPYPGPYSAPNSLSPGDNTPGNLAPGNPYPGPTTPGNPVPGNPDEGNPEPGNPAPGNPESGNPEAGAYPGPEEPAEHDVPGNPEPANPAPGNPAPAQQPSGGGSGEQGGSSSPDKPARR